MKYLRKSLIVLMLNFFSFSAHADQSEFEVYSAGMPEKSESGFDLAMNAAQSPSQSESVQHSLIQAIGEYSYGLDDQFAIGVRLPIYHLENVWRGYGLLGEIKYIAPHSDQGFYWGSEIEAGYISPFQEKRGWILEVMPILGYRIGRWEFVTNPGLAITSAGEERGVVTFEPNSKISYQVTREYAVGIEYFIDAGSLSSFAPRDQRREVAYLTLDTMIAKNKINVGLGHGTTESSPRWIAKLIVDLEFD